MTYEEKFKTVIDAIQEAVKISVPTEPVKLNFTNENKLMLLSLEDTTAILLQLQDIHKVLIITARANTKWLTGWDPYTYERDFFHLAVFDNFQDWVKSQFKEESINKEVTELAESENSNTAINKIWTFLTEIDEKRLLGLDDQPIKVITRFSVIGNGIVGDYDTRKAIIDKLVSWDALEKYRKITFNGSDYFKFQIGKNYKKVFEVIKTNIRIKDSVVNKDPAQDRKIAEKDIVYKITYTEQTREIFINNFLMKQPRSFGNNDSVFAFLYKNPNKDLSLNEIEASIGINDIDLNKVVENLGFKADYRQVFFKVSKDRIRLNNPITREQLQALSIKSLKIS